MHEKLIPYISGLLKRLPMKLVKQAIESGPASKTPQASVLSVKAEGLPGGGFIARGESKQYTVDRIRPGEISWSVCRKLVIDR